MGLFRGDLVVGAKLWRSQRTIWPFPLCGGHKKQPAFRVMDQQKTWVPHRLGFPASRERKSKFLLLLSCPAFVLAKVNRVRDAYTFVSKPYDHIYNVISNLAELERNKRREKPEASSVHPTREDLIEWGEGLLSGQPVQRILRHPLGSCLSQLGKAIPVSLLGDSYLLL